MKTAVWTFIIGLLALASNPLNAGGALSVKGDWKLETSSSIGLSGTMDIYKEELTEDGTLFEAEVFWCQPDNVISRLVRGNIALSGAMLMTELQAGDEEAPYLTYAGNFDSIDSSRGITAAIDEAHAGTFGRYTMDRLQAGQNVNWNGLGYDCPL